LEGGGPTKRKAVRRSRRASREIARERNLSNGDQSPGVFWRKRWVESGEEKNLNQKCQDGFASIVNNKPAGEETGVARAQNDDQLTLRAEELGGDSKEKEKKRETTGKGRKSRGD